VEKCSEEAYTLRNTKGFYEIRIERNTKILGNPKSKAQNPKQIPNSKFQFSKQVLNFDH